MDERIRTLGDPARRDAMVESLRESLPEAIDELLAGLFAGTPLIRSGCAAVLDHAPQDDRIVRALVQATGDPDWRVRKGALHSLSCGHCKPDGCMPAMAIDTLVRGMLHDSDARVRMFCAGVMMWGQAGTSPEITEAFRTVLDTSPNRTLRERAAIYLASLDVPRGPASHREWHPRWQQRQHELLTERVIA